MSKLEDLKAAIQEGIDSGDAGLLDMDEIIREAREQWKGPKSHWNYRIYRYSEEQGSGLGIHEAHYENGKVVGYSASPIIVGDDIEELKDVLAMMGRDIERWKADILDYDSDDHPETSGIGGTEFVTLSIDRDVLEYFRKGGPVLTPPYN